MKLRLSKRHLLLFLLAFSILLMPELLHAQVPPIPKDVGNWVTSQFQDAVQGFSSKIISIATRLFWILATISLVWTGITLIGRNGDIGEWAVALIRFILVTGFFLWLLTNSTAIAGSIITGLSKASVEVGGGNAGQVTSILQMALKFSKTASENMGILDPARAFSWGLVTICIILIACYMIVTVSIAICSATFLVYVGIIVLGFGGGRWTSDIAVNYYKAVIAAGLKLFALNLLMATAVELVNKIFANSVTQIGQAYLALATLTIIAMLVDKIPAMIGGLVSHIGSESHTFGGGMMGVAGSSIGLAAQGVTALASGGTSAVATAAARVAQGAAHVSSTLKNLSK